MKITWGGTRFVILTGHHAFKIARIRPLRTLFRLISFPFVSRGNRARFRARYAMGDSLAMAFWRYFVWGWYCNLIESTYSAIWDDPRVIPTVSAFKYLVNVQTRGLPVTDEDVLAEFGQYPPDRLRAHQYVRLGGRIVLVDYGNLDSIARLFLHPAPLY